MPFTFSHPAILLPLSKVSKTKLSFTGLIVGSLSPDFEYFILMQMRRTHGHELSSFFWFTLPLCILLAFLYHGIVKTPFIRSLPSYLYSRLAIYNQFNWMVYFTKYWYVFIYSAAIGVFSHILWDSFTHDHGLFGRTPPIFHTDLSGNGFQLYELLQWLSTAFGGLAMMLFIHKLPVSGERPEPILKKILFWFNVIFIICFIFSLKPIHNLSDVIATTIGATLYAIVGSAIYATVYEKVYSNRNYQL